MIKNNVQRLFKQKMTWFVIGIISILSVYLIMDFNNQSKEYNDFYLNQTREQISTINNDLTIVDIGIKSGNVGNRKIDVSNAIEYKNTLMLLLESTQRKERAILENDWETYHNEQLFYDYWNVSNYIYDINHERNSKVIEESTEIIDLQTEVKDKMNYPELVFSSDGLTNVMKDFRYYYKTRLLYSYQLVENEVFTQPVNRYTMNGSTFIYHFFAQFWFILFVLHIALNSGILDDKKNNHSNKGFIAQYILSIGNTLIVVLIPLVLISIILSLFKGASSLNLPVLVNSMSWKSFVGIENNLKYDFLGNGGNFAIGLSYFSSYPRGSGEMSALLGFMPLMQFYGLTFILFLFNLGFISSIILLINRIIKSKLFVTGITLIICVLGVFLSQIDPNAIFIKFNPYSGMNMILLNGGSSSITLLNSIIVLSISTIILLGVNQYLDKQ